MPGLHGKEVDTTNWNAADWRRARCWNTAFLVAWCAFFTYALDELLYSSNGLLFATFAGIGIVGAILQLVWLVRASLWLNRQSAE